MQNLKKYNKLVDTAKEQQTHRYKEQSRLGVTSRERDEGHLRGGSVGVQTTGYKIGSRLYCTTWGI